MKKFLSMMGVMLSLLPLVAKADLEADWISEQKAAQAALEAFYAEKAAGTDHFSGYSQQQDYIRGLMRRAMRADVRIDTDRKGFSTYDMAKWSVELLDDGDDVDRVVIPMRYAQYVMAMSTAGQDMALGNDFVVDKKKCPHDACLAILRKALKLDGKQKNGVTYAPEILYLIAVGQLYGQEGFSIVYVDKEKGPAIAAEALQQCVSYLGLPDLVDARGNRVHPEAYRYLVYCADLMARLYQQGVGVPADAAKAKQVIVDAARVMSIRLAGMPSRNGVDGGRIPFMGIVPELQVLLR